MAPQPPLENATQTLKTIQQSQEKQQQYCLTMKIVTSCRFLFFLTEFQFWLFIAELLEQAKQENNRMTPWGVTRQLQQVASLGQSSPLSPPALF